MPEGVWGKGSAPTLLVGMQIGAATMENHMEAPPKNQNRAVTCSGFPGWLGREGICLQRGRPGLGPWVGKTPWRRAGQPTPASLPGQPHRQRSLAGCSPRGHRETDTPDRQSTNTHALDSTALLPGAYLGKTGIYRDTCSPVLVTARLTVARTRKRRARPSTGE